ncbi:hypothetical protein KC347_g7084 [Hortaea werneckii]|nr:hypothetical protein KC347_g7084 [Hortaea werneckii]
MVLPYDYNGFQAPPNLATTDHFDLLGVDPYRPTRHTYDELLQMARRVTGLLYAMESFAVPPTLPVRYSVQEAETMVQYLEEGQTFGGPDFVVAAFYTLQHGRYAYYESTSTWNPHTAIPPFRVRTEVTVPMPGRLPLVPTPESSFPGEPVDDSSGPPSSAASDDFEPGGRFGQGNATMNPHFRPPPSSKSPTPSTGAPEYDNEPQHAIAAGEPTQTPAGSPPSRTNSLPRYRERTPARPTDQPGQSTDRHRSPSRRQSVSPARSRDSPSRSP